MNSIRAIGIVRVSQRVDDSGQSPEVQRRAITALAEEHGWSLRPEDILDENVDGKGRVRKVSGSWELKDRPKLRYAIEEVEGGRARVIVGERFDRMFRNELLRRMTVKRIEEAGGELWSAKAGQMTNQGAEGTLAHNVNGDVSEYTRETAKERSFDAVEVAIEQGRVPWPNVPPGLIRNDDGTVRPDPKLAPLVVGAFELRDDGATITEVRAYLRDGGIERSYHGVTKMLRDPLYVGEIHFGGTHVPNLKAYEPPVVDRDLFDRVQGNVIPRGPRPKSPRLLARLARVLDGQREPILRCFSCSSGMVIGTQRQNGRTYPFYRCPNAGKGGDHCRRRMAIGADLAEGVIVDAVKAELANVKGRADPKAEAREAAAEAEYDRANLGHAVTALEDFGDEAAVAKLKALKAKAAASRARAERLGGRKAAVTINAARDWDRLTLEEQRAIILATGVRATVKPGRGRDRVEIDFADA